VDSLVSQGAPIDMDKVARIKAAIAEGRYPVNPQVIAQKMIELDLPTKG
jgi:negative regulator of flagellin synthesis FlgM